jgi:hypothetical protein
LNFIESYSDTIAKTIGPVENLKVEFAKKEKHDERIYLGAISVSWSHLDTKHGNIDEYEILLDNDFRNKGNPVRICAEGKIAEYSINNVRCANCVNYTITVTPITQEGAKGLSANVSITEFLTGSK